MPEAIGLQVSGTGHSLPARRVDNAYFERTVETSDQWIRERTGIQFRHFAAEGESTLSLSAAAATAALADAGLTPADLDMIIVGTVTPETIMPATACHLQHHLGCRTIAAVDICVACSGFLYGLSMAAGMLRTGQYRHILVVGAETLSRITDMQDRGTCILFGDGAGAAIVTAMPDASGPVLLHHRLGADGGCGHMLTLPAGGSRLPASAMTVNERLHFMQMKGRELFKVAVVRMVDLIQQTLAEAGVSVADLDLVVPHQSNARIIEACRDKLGLPEEKMYVNIDRLGNTSAASVPIALDELRRAGRVRPGSLVLLVAFGAGLTWGTALLRM